VQEFEATGRVWFRNVLTERELSTIESSSDLDGVAGHDLIPVRVVAFNKTGDSNWGVPWHQDRVIAVTERHENPAFKNWSRKNGVWYCEPPAEILNQMFFVRVHLDDNTPENGGMKISLGSHKRGVVPAAEAQKIAEGFPFENCNASRGDVLVLKMLTLHASSPSTLSSPRRAFRIDYAPADLLPAPLAWAGPS